MDYHLLDIELDDDRLYEDMRKTSFVLLQKRIFDSLRKRGDTKMLLPPMFAPAACAVRRYSYLPEIIPDSGMPYILNLRVMRLPIFLGVRSSRIGWSGWRCFEIINK
jgi:hypothetical protein